MPTSGEGHILPDDLAAAGLTTLVDLDITTTSANPRKSNKRKPKGLRKAPQAPKRFKSSYICFFTAKQAQIKDELGDKASVSAVSKRCAELWKNVSPEERAHWDDVAMKDKQRYMQEKAVYTGPWQVPFKRHKKNPSAPKRPMSAFLFYSIGRRGELKVQNPGLKNTEISRLLGAMWRGLSQEERDPYVQEEKEKREIYKKELAEWKRENEAKEEAARAAQAEQTANMNPNGMPMYDMMGNLPPPLAPGFPGQMMHPFNYAPPPQQYYLPTNGKTPVVLAPTGVPYTVPVPPAMAPTPYSPFDDGQVDFPKDYKEDFNYSVDDQE